MNIRLPSVRSSRPYLAYGLLLPLNSLALTMTGLSLAATNSLASVRNTIAAPRTTTVSGAFDSPVNGTASAENNTCLLVPRTYQFTTATAMAPGTFSGGSDLAVGNGPASVAVGDVDGDGDLDFVAANANYYGGGSGTVSVGLNGSNASGSNTGVFSLGTTVAVGDHPLRLALGDVDHDGDLDLLTANANSDGTVSVRLNGGDNHGGGKGVFSGGADYSVGPYPIGIAVGDVDGDGDLDLLTASSGGNTISVRLNGGDSHGGGTGAFYNGSDPAVGSGPQLVAVGDLDGDGDLDFVATNQDNTISVRLNGGDNHGGGTGVFYNGYDPAVTSPGGVTLGDVDGDGDLDLLLSSGSTNTVSVRLNGGDNHGGGTGVFSGGSDLPVSSPGTLALGDVDGDGDPDLLVTSGNTNTVSVRLNGGNNHGGGTGVFSGGSDPAVGTNPSSVAVGDVDGDGDLDLVVANYNNGNSGTVSVRLNQPAQIPPAITKPPTSTLVCAGSAATFSVVATNATGYQWQVKSGSSFIDLGNTAPYSGVTTSTLTIMGVTAALSGTQYRVVVSGNGPSVTSSAATLTVNSAPTPTVALKPASSVYTGGNAAALYLGYGPQSVTLTAAGGTTYQWSPAAGLSTGTGASTVFTATKPGTYTYLLTATSAAGCQATTSITLTVTDVRCGNKNDKVIVCHQGSALCIDDNAVAAHLAHGDQLGNCPTATTAKTSTATASATATTESQMLDLHNLLEVYPNPMAAQATLHFHTAEGGKVQVYVYDQVGRLVTTLYNAEVQRGQDYTVLLASADYASGVYFCRLITNGQVLNVRLTVAK